MICKDFVMVSHLLRIV